MRRDNNNKWGEIRDSLSEDWTKYLSDNFQEYNFIPIPNNPSNAIKFAISTEIEGLILSNGNDWGSCPERDQTEMDLIKWCRSFGKPILGVCRGFQILNKYFGGELKKDLTNHTKNQHAGSIHKIQIIDKNFSLNNLSEFRVNSFHNQGVLAIDLADNLVPFAISENIIEGFYHINEPIIGIQWHPERNNIEEEFDKNLFKKLFANNIFL